MELSESLKLSLVRESTKFDISKLPSYAQLYNFAPLDYQDSIDVLASDTGTYVTATDSFLSGWGGAENKIAKRIVICRNFDQAEACMKAMKRDGFKHVNISLTIPRYASKYVVTVSDFNDSPAWNEKYFKENPEEKIERK